MEVRRYRRGDAGEDGLVFWKYSPATGRPVWVTPQVLAERREKIRLAVRRHYRANTEKQRAMVRERYKRPEVKAVRKAYIARPEVRARQNHLTRIRMQKRRNEDPVYRMECAVRNRTRKALQGILKDGKSLDLIGCTPKTLRLIVESKFEPGMTWDNYGSEWHVDHIIPLSAYDLTDPEQQRQAFHYTNLQPLWAHENLAKGDEVPGTELILRLLEAA